MDRRFAPNFCFLLLWVALANGALVQTGGQPHQLQEPSLKSSRSIKSNSRVKRSVNDGDGERLNSGEANGELLKLFSRQLPTKVAEKRDTDNNIDSIAERDGISGNLYPETAIHNLEQTSDKVESDMQYRRSKIPARLENGALAEDTRDTRVDNKAVYNIGQEASLEIPLTTKIDQPRIEELTKRDVIPQEDRFPLINGGEKGSRLLSGDTVKSNSENQEGSSLINNDKTGSSKARLGETTSTRKSTATRRNEVPLLGPGILRNSLDDASDEDFQVRDKSADLEIHADSSGVRVKAKPASLQVVSNPHGDVKTLPGETHSEGVVAERRTFTPVLPAEKRTHHHHHLGGLGPRPLAHIPFLRHHHHFHRRHRLPWLRHREHINYPDVFERMRFNSMPEGLSPFGGMGPPLAMAPPMAPPMASMMGSSPPMIGSPPLMMSEGPGMSLMGGGGMGGGGMGGGGMGGGGMGGEGMGGGGMSGPLIPQLLQRSPTMETNPANRFGVPQNPMEEMSPGGIPPMGRINPMGDMSPMVKLGSMGDMSAMGRMGPMSDMSPMSRMNTMGDASPMGRMGSMGEMAPIGGMGPMESMMGPMSPSSPYGQSEMGRKNALEFWGLPNQDQIKALMRGENVQKVLGSNRYGESLGGITPGGMNPGMGGASFNANGMGDNMMGSFGGSGNSMFRGMSGGMSNMMGMRRNMLYKKDSIDKTDAYKKSMKLKESSHHKTVPAVKSDHAVDGTTRSGQQKFEDGILKKAQSLVAGEKHVAKNEESELHREHRIRKSSKSEEKRSLDDEHSEKTTEKHQKVKNVKGSKKDVAVQRPPIIYHPPPEVFHRPDIVLHRPPVLFHRPPIVYHQAPVVVHRPAVVYRQSPIVFHQPFPMVNQPYYRAWDNFQMNPAYSHVGSHVAQAYNYLGTPPAVAGYRKGVVPHKPKAEGKNGRGDEKKEGKRTEIPKHKDEKKSDVDKNEVAQKKKKDVVVNRPPIIYHPPPEVYHRPEIVVHRAPLLIKRPPIIYHQPAVIVHRPPVVYHQPPLIFHQPAPTVNQPVLYSHDNFVVHPSFFATHHGSVVSDAGRLLGVPNTISVPDGIGFPFEPAGANPGLVPGGLGMPGGMGMPPIAPMGRRKRSLHHKRKKPKHENGKRKNAVMVKRPPIVYHPPPEVYHRPDIVVHRAPLVVHRSPIIYHQAPVIVHRPAVVYHQPPVLFHQPPPMVTQPTFTSHDMYSPHHSLTLVGSTPPTPTFSNVALVASKPSQKSSIKKKNKSNSEKKLHTEKVFRKDRVKLDSEKHSKKNKIRKHKSVEREDGSKKGHISRTKEGKASKKNAVLVKRPSIVYHPPPEVYHRPDIVVHRAPLVIHRSPIIYHQAPVIVHRPAVVYHQPPVLFHQPPPVVNQPVLTAHDVYHETSSLTHSSSSLTPHGVYLGVPSEIMTHPATAYGKSKVPSQRKHHQKHRRDITKEKSSKKNTIVNEDKTEKASKKNAVLVKRPPIIYHPPPEVYHRPDIVVHRAPIVIHRAPLVYHQAPVIVHRPAVVYHQPAVIFHQPPPMVHQPMLTSHDTFTPHDTLVLGGSTTEKVGDFEGPPPEAFATRKGEVPKNVKGTSRNTIPKESKDEKNKPQLYTSKDKGEYPHRRSMESKGDKSKGKERHSQRRSHLRKLILSLQKDGNHAKKGLQVAAGSPLVLQRPPLIMSRPAVVAPALGHSLVAPMAHPLIQRVIQPVPVYQPVVRQVPVPVIRPVPIPVVYHHHHWPMHFHHNHIQPVMMPPPHYTSYSYHPYSFGKSDVPHHKKDQSDVSESSQQKDTIHVHDFGVPAHGHVGHVNGNSHVVTHHGYVTRHADCPSHCGTCQPPSCPSDCDPHCVAIIHHQHHRPHHIFMNHLHHHNIAQTHFHDHHWPVHHHDVYHNHPYFPHRHIGHLLHTYPPYHHHGRRDTDSDESSGHDRKQKTTVPHYKVYQHVKHWHPPCIHNSHTCHHHHHPMTIYHDHHHPTTVLHHHHFTPYPVYHHHEHIKPVIFHHLRPYPIHHHHEHLIHDTWHHDHHHHHVLPPTPYPVPVSIPTPVELPVPVRSPLPIPVPIPQQSWMPQPPLSPCAHVACAHHVFGRSHVPYNVPMETKKSETGVPDKGKKKSEISKTKNKKKDVVVNRPPIIYHPPPEVYHRPEIVVHRAPVLVHRPPIVYHQPAVIVHRPPVVYHQSPVIFHQPAPTVNQPVLYSHDNFVVHPTMLASHAGTMVESAGHFLGVPSGSITNFPGPLSPYGAPEGFGTTPYATPFGRKRRSTKESPKYQNESTQNENEDTQKRDKNAGKDKNSEKSHNSRKANRKNAIVVHRPPVVYHPPPEIYHRPRVIVHRPDVLIHRPPIVYHQSPVVLHRPPVVYHQAPLVFHQPPPMINQPVYHSHDAYAPHPVFTHYNSDVHHVGAYLGVPPYAEEYHGGGYHGFGGFHGFPGGSSGLHGGFGGYPGLYGGIGGIHGGFGGFHGPFAPGFGRSEIEKPNQKKNKEHNKKAKGHKKSSAKSEKAHRKHSVMVHRPPVIFHPPPEIYHRPAYVIHQPDIVIHRPATVYHQSPVVVHHPPIAYHQHPVVYHQPPPIIVQPTYHHHQFFQECHVHGCYGGGPRLYGGHGGCFGHGCGPHLFGGFGGCFGHGCGFGGGFHGGYPFLYGKSNVPNDNHSNKDTKTPAKHKALSDDSEESKKHHKHTDGNTEHKTSNAKASNQEAVKETKGSKKNDIVIHRPPLVYHPPPEIYHRPDVVVHRPDVLVHRPSVVYDQPAVVLHRPAVVYHEPDVVFHQPPPLVNLPVYHASDIYAPHPVYEHTDSQVDYSNNVVGVPPHFSFGPYGVSHAFGKSRIEGSDDKAEKDSGDEKKAKKDENDPGSVKENDNSERDPGIETAQETYSERSEIVKESSRKRHHSGKHASRHTKEKSRTTKAHKKYHLIMHRPPLIYHSSPTIYHRPDVVVHHPDIVIHRPSVVVQPPSVVIHKPAVVYHQPPVVFHQPEPAIHQPVYHSHDSYEAHPVYTHVGSHLDHGGEYLAYPGMEYPNYGYDALPGFGKSKIQETEEKHTKENDEERHDKPERGNDKHVEKKQPEKEQHKDEEQEKKQHKHAKRDTQFTKTKRVQLPHAQKERTETGTKKNAIVVKRPPIIYHPPPEVYHRPDIVVHRAPIVIQRAPLVYHQSPVIVHRPAVVYHQPAVVFHQPAPAVHQPVFHSVDTFSVHPHLSFTQAGSSVHQTGQYVGIPQEVMHRSTVPTSSDLSNAEHTDSNPRSSVPADSHPKQRRATIVHDVAPITPLNFIHPRHPRFETPRSTIPYPTLHPYSLSYASFPWGYSPKTKRSVEGNPYPHPEIATMVPHELYPLPYSPFYHPTPLQRPHVNVNIETVKSNVPKRKNRERRQSIFGPSQLQEPYPMQPGIDELHPGQMMPYPGIGPYPNLPRPHVNVNVETIKSAVPRDKRQVLAGLPAQEIPPSLAPQTYSQAVVPAQLPTSPELGVYRDLLGAIYPRGAHRRPKVNIVVQTAKSSIPTPQNLKKSVLPSSLNKGNVDAFNTMPEVTTIEPPLLRDGVRVNMVDLGDPTAGSNSVHPANFAPKLQPSFGSTNMQSYGTNILGLGAQGNFGMDKWKKSAITKPSTLWHDVNAQKKSSVPSVHREAGGKKRFMIDGFNSPGQFPGFQSGLEPQGSIPLAQPTSGGFASRASYLAEPEGSIAQLAATAGFNSPAGYAAEPQGYPPQSSGATEQGQPEPANSESQVSGIQQPGRPHVNVNVDTFKKHTLGSNGLPSKRQLIGTLPLTSLFRPNPNTAKASLRSMVPNRNPQPVKNSAQPVTKRQQIMRRVPLAQAIPQLRNRVTTRRGSPASATRGYATYPVQDTQPQIPRSNPYQGVQPVSRQPVSRQQVFTAPFTSPISPPISQSFVNPSPLLPAASPYLRPTIYPWGGRRPHVNINVQTTKSNIPAKSERTSTPSKPNKIITPRFKREFPVLYNIIKAKAKLDSAKRDGRTRRDKRQIPMFPGGGFLQSLIPDPNLLAKRAFYGSVPRYPINPAVLIPRASQPRPQRQPMGTIEVGGSNAESPVPNAANLLRNEFSQSFADIAKIQRQEVNAIKGMNMANQAPSPSVLNMPEQATPSAQVVSLPSQGSAPGLVSGPAATASAVPVQEQAQQPQVVPVSAQQTMATFAAAPQTLPARGQSLPAQFSRLAPLEIAPGFVRGKTEPLIQGQAVQASEPTLEAAAPADQAPEPSIGASQPAVSKKSPFTVMAPGQLPPGFQPQFPVPVQFPFFPAAELPPQPAFAPPEEIPQALPYPRPFFNPIPQPEADDSDRPSVNIQVQTSKSKIPKLQGKKEDTKNDKKKTH